MTRKMSNAAALICIAFLLGTGGRRIEKETNTTVPTCCWRPGPREPQAPGDQVRPPLRRKPRRNLGVIYHHSNDSNPGGATTTPKIRRPQKTTPPPPPLIAKIGLIASEHGRLVIEPPQFFNMAHFLETRPHHPHRAAGNLLPC